MCRLLLRCFLLLLLVVLAGCGNKGPLVLPDEVAASAETLIPASASSVNP